MRVMTAARFVSVVLLLTISLAARAGDGGPWHGRPSAVCLTYDDALNVHLDTVVPLLDSLGFRATFYISGSFPGFTSRLAEWRTVAARGNELGNHTLFHPCEGKRPGREWVQPLYDLTSYTVQRMADEIGMMDVLLRAVDGKARRTFAYPCGDTTAGDSSYVGYIRGRFPGARGVAGKMQQMHDIDPYDIGCFMINGQSGDELIALVKKAIKNKALLVLLFHGVGGEHSINVTSQAHRQLLQFLRENANDIWVAPLIDIVEYMKPG